MHDALAVTAHLVEHASGACTSIHPGASALLTPYRGKEEIIISSRHRLDKTSADICSNTPVLRDTAKKGLVADVDSFPSPGLDEKYYRGSMYQKYSRAGHNSAPLECEAISLS